MVDSEEKLTFDFVYEHYDNIRYTSPACKGEWYYLKNYYPLCMEVADKPTKIYLDTGGPMEGCDFDMFEFTKTGLYRNGKKIAILDFRSGLELASERLEGRT